MNPPRPIRWLGAALACGWIAGAWIGCSASGNRGNTTETQNAGGNGGTSTGSAHTSTGGKASGSSTGGSTGSFHFPDAGCTPPTCAELKANCGAVTDTKCGGFVQCGSCPAGQTCGNGGPNQCGTGSSDACAPLTCAQQNANCGQVGDGCGNTISCGSCNAPQSCGGGNQPNTCGCTGVCAQIPDCSEAGGTTTLSGTVLDPAGIHPLYNALVYIPNNPKDPGLQPFAAGITCDVCGATAAGDPLVTAYTAPDGTFTLQNVPVGTSLPLVVQLGRWRRQFTVDVGTSCGANSIPAGTLTMPKNSSEGDIPRIGILTGSFDPIECVLRKMGVQDSEFTNPGTWGMGGHIQLYRAGQQTAASFNPYPGCPFYAGSGAIINGSTPAQAALFGTSGAQPTINQYDLVIMACEGYEENEKANWAALGAYTSAGGRVFTTDFAYDWMASTFSGGLPQGGAPSATNPAYAGAVTWQTGQNAQGSPDTGIIDLVSNPKGMAFEQWLQIVGASAAGSGTVSLNPVFHNDNAVVAPTQQWLYSGQSGPIHLTFNTPVGATAANQCGRMVYSDWHADQLNLPAGQGYEVCYLTSNVPPFLSHGMTFPSECDSNPMTPQEAILEFMLFDLTACVQPYTPLCTPTTCQAQGIECGPAGDGCGNLLMCGTCPAGEYCGGGGPGKCGMMNTCTPSTCAMQNIECGQAGDGCGNVINCGNCPTGEVCGLGGAGKCGMTH